MTAAAATGADGTWIDDWIGIGTDGRVTLRTGKVEIGTGLMTALAQIAAEELDVDVAQLDVVSGHTDRSPNEGYTAGSRSISEGGAAVRRAAAEARAVLLELAADHLAVPAAHLTVTSGVVQSVTGNQISYAQLLGGRLFGRRVTGQAPLKPVQEYRVVGTPVARIDIPHKVWAKPSFVTDVRLPNMLHARVIRPRWFDCTLLSVDTSALPPAARLVRIGDFLAVLAEREAIAVAAAKAVTALWSQGRESPTMDKLYEWIQDQESVNVPLRTRSGEARAEAHDADAVLQGRYEWPFQAHASIGPACAVADVRPDGATIYAAAQGVYQLRAGLSALLGIDGENIEVVHREGTGCYGHNGADDVAADAAILSQHVGRPVRVQWSREDEFVWARKGPATLALMSAALSPTGQIVGWESDFFTPTHGGRAKVPERFVGGHLRAAVPGPEDVNFVGGERNAPVDYEVPQQVTMRWLKSSAIPSSSLRALGATANTFANESFVDELALRAGMDPVAFRLQHLSDPRGIAVIEAVAAASDLEAELPAGSGRGLAYARYENHAAYLAAVAQVSVDRERGVVTVEKFTIAHDCGLIINPDGLRNQIEGNVLQSLSRTLMEEIRWDESGLLTVDWETYPILRFDQVPKVEVILIDRPQEPSFGAGEPATILTAPAVANAIARAVGIRLRQVPFTPRRVRQAMSESQNTTTA